MQEIGVLLSIIGFCVGAYLLLSYPAHKRDEARKLAEARLAQDKSDEKRFIEKINRIVNQNSDEVISSYRQTVKTSSLGVKNYRGFSKDLREFLELRLDAYDINFLYRTNHTFKSYFDSWMAAELIRVIESNYEDTLIADDIGASSGGNYEREVANIVRSCGWAAQVTKGSGDQGVDVIASIGLRRAAIQCKYFAKPVGNAAIQQITSGRVHYRAQIGLVVAPNGFTESARALAKSNGVILCHHSDLKRELAKLK